MTPATRRNIFKYAAVVALILICLVFRRAFYVFERAALGLRYFGWLLLTLVAGVWLLSMIGRGRK